MDPHEQRADFEVAAREPSLWLGHARQLWRAAQAVHREFAHHFADLRSLADAPDEDVALSGPYLLPSGMAVECLLKGVLLRRRPELVRDGHLARSGWPGRRGGHDLAAIAGEVSPALAARHADLLARLELCVVWGGRYPVPLKAGHFTTQPFAAAQPPVPRFQSSDPVAIQRLFDELVAMLRSPDVPGRANGA